MTVESILIPVLTFMLGSLITSIYWMQKYGDRLARLETNQKNMQETLARIVPAEPHPCQYHIDLDKRVVGVETTVYGATGK